MNHSINPRLPAGSEQMLGAIHIDPPHYLPVRGAEFIAARQIEDGAHTGTGGGEAWCLQQIALKNLYPGAKKPAGFRWITAKDP